MVLVRKRVSLLWDSLAAEDMGVDSQASQLTVTSRECAMLHNPGPFIPEISIFYRMQFCTLAGHKLSPAHWSLNLSLSVSADYSQTLIVLSNLSCPK